MGDQRALVVNVETGPDVALIDLIFGLLLAGHDGEFVDQIVALLDQLGLQVAVTVQPAEVERLHITAQTLMQPHVVGIAVGHLIAEPLVRHLVMQQPVVVLAVQLVAVAVGVDRLVLHAQVWCPDDAQLLVRKRVWSDGRLIEIDHGPDLVEQGAGLDRIVGRQMPVLDREAVAEPALVGVADLDIGADVQGDRIGVWVGGGPVPRRPAVAVIDLAHELSVGRCRQV